MAKGNLGIVNEVKGDVLGAKKILTTRDVVTPAGKQDTSRAAVIITTRDVKVKK
jgi:hypothetical protein